MSVHAGDRVIKRYVGQCCYIFLVLNLRTFFCGVQFGYCYQPAKKCEVSISNLGTRHKPNPAEVQYIEDIKRWREDMNFMFEWQEQ